MDSSLFAKLIDVGFEAEVKKILPSDLLIGATQQPGFELVDSELLDLLKENERRLVNKSASKKRIIEFCLGRLAGRRAANFAIESELGETVEILKDENGAPNWGVQLTGSISHCSGKAVAVVGMDKGLFWTWY